MLDAGEGETPPGLTAEPVAEDVGLVCALPLGISSGITVGLAEGISVDVAEGASVGVGIGDVLALFPPHPAASVPTNNTKRITAIVFFIILASFL